MVDDAQILVEVLEFFGRNKAGLVASGFRIEPDTRLFDGGPEDAIDLGVDSMDITELAMALEEAFGFVLPDELDFSRCESVSDLSRMITAIVNE